MRKLLVVALIVFAAAFTFGATAPATANAGSCYYTCTCEGVPLYCCVSHGVTTCKGTKVIECTLGYNC